MGGSILKWKDRKNRLNVAGSCVYFDSEDYKAPMSFYEPSLLSVLFFHEMYGTRMRGGGECPGGTCKTLDADV